jgi:hypothetical protein
MGLAANERHDSVANPTAEFRTTTTIVPSLSSSPQKGSSVFPNKSVLM